MGQSGVLATRAAALAITVGLLSTGAILAENIDPDGDDSRFAYGENAGWLNARPSGDGGPGVQVDDFALSGWLWGENIGWVSLSCENTSSCGTVDYGVSNDGHGNLSGYAWAENAGWIGFSCSDTDGCGAVSYGVTIDVVTGDFNGRAWAENAGWITFASNGSYPYKVTTGWCRSVVAAPSGTPSLTVDKSGIDAILSWTTAAGGADWYEIVQGDIGTLRASQGDFAAATEQCIGNDVPGTSTYFSGDPASGAGFWFLVRGVNCKGKGTYDSLEIGQAEPRDGGIDVSGNDCP